MDFFVYSRDAPNSSSLRDELLEAHWSYMDAFAETMVARGPTLAADRETATGSLHVVGLPTVEAANEFVVREPNHQAGVYAEHSVWRFDNLLGRTMWEYEGAGDEPQSKRGPAHFAHMNLTLFTGRGRSLPAPPAFPAPPALPAHPARPASLVRPALDFSSFPRRELAH